MQLAFGVDALQALIQAIEGLRVALEKTGRNFFWLDQEQGVGIPLYVPMFQGKRFEERVRLAIEREMIRAWRGVIKQRKRDIRSAARRLGLAAGTKRSLEEAKARLARWEAELAGLVPGWSRPSRDE